MNGMNPAATSIVWFVAIIVIIPIALWLLKRSPIGGGAAGGVMRTIAALPISTSQRIVTIEVGQGEQRRWLVLGVTAQSITTLHTMEPQAELPSLIGAAGANNTPFAQMLNKLRHPKPTDLQAGLRNDQKDPGAR
jgi:flagellar protein FliO/FliZ